ncbi:CxC2 domain-containing protein [Mycena indigotica]|uniref:CxC2 domain-containing protein n=1 Tax=Mycena indigotica TaxID=2126181 RepID=A0A8H6SXJ4_9AGAR|nr:CxC2 domain-containing protein [Mycena indigotica]KAF7306960.1 CxC2 domain-containing protein [Mycena indigotica]
MARMEEGVTKAAAKYTEGYEALVHLKGKRYAPEFQKLDKAHLNTRIEIESDEDAARSLRTADGSRPTREETAAKKKKTKTAPISWIWAAGGQADGVELHDCDYACRVGKSTRARKERWNEEVELLREEMKRVMRSLKWEASEWQKRADEVRSDVDGTTAAGIRAYALRNVYLHTEFIVRFREEWDKTMGAAVRHWAAEEEREILEGTFMAEGM